jgi:ketosteroid isomerase-like protein
MELDNSVCLVWTVENGKLASFETVRDRDDALEAVGLRE